MHSQTDCNTNQDNLQLVISSAEDLYEITTPFLGSYFNNELLPLENFQNFIQDLHELIPHRNNKKKLTDITRRAFACKNTQCAICQQKINRYQLIPKLKCKHKYHHQCLAKWYQKQQTCPLCRHSIGQ